MMKIKTGWKVLALAASVALCFALTACYVPADEVTDDTSGSLNNMPWQTVDPATAAPVVTEAPVGLVTTAPQQVIVPTATPYTVQLSTATPTIGSYGVSTNPPSAATPTLKAATPSPTTFLYKRGSNGATVKTIQQRLKDLGYYTGSVDGDFGASTETAVKNFQKTNGLTADGVVGSTTYAKLTSSSALKAGSTPTPKAITTLKQGSTGSSVRTVQQRLKALGYYTGAVDGSYGASTTAAVKAFQTKNGLKADGKVGTTTWTRLNSSAAIAANATATPASMTTLKLGSTGSAVKDVQKRLKALGYYTGSIDGIYGATVQTAVKNFQNRNGLSSDGTVGSLTYKKLFSDSAKAASGFVTATPTAKATVTPRPNSIVAQPGDDNDTVKGIQNRLKELGYFTATATGYYGDVTTDAVKRFQKANGLSVTGTVDIYTRNQLNSSKAKSANGATAKPTATPIAGNGSNGETVKTIQQRLKDLGYFTADVTGHYGSVTSAAVKAFQKANGLTETGSCDKATYDLLLSSKAKAKGTATPKPTATPNPNIIAQKGSTGALVSTIQQRLKDLGYFTDSVTDYYGTKSVAAVKAFQKANGLADTGSCDQATYDLLMSKKAKAVGTATPKATATPNPVTIAKKGDTNAIVTEIQNRLHTLGYLESSATGSYGNATVTAVKEFQTANRLAATGVCDQDTYNLLLSSKAKAKSTAKPSATATPNPNVIAKKGDDGSIVFAIQERLIALGYLDSKATSSYGSNTVAAVKAFQKAHAIADTGICDQSTYNLLMSSKAKPKATATPTPSPTPNGSVIAKPGDVSELVMTIQQRLKELGYFTGSTTETYGSKTKAAVEEFQANNGLAKTGTCDQNTYKALMSSKAKPKHTATPSPTVTPNPVTIAKKGDTGDTVKLIQTRLIEQGYLTSTVTGTYGSATQAAVKKFQTVNRLAATGICDQDTYNLLVSGKGKPNPTAVPGPTSKPNTNIYLQEGSSSSNVTRLQNRLIELGYLTGKATGKFNGATIAAVKAFQQDSKLYNDGIAGPNTLTMIYGANPKTRSTPVAVIGITLESSAQGQEVTILQRRLKALGYLDTSANGSYGEKTVEAVKAFQKDNSMTETGKATPGVLDAIFHPDAAPKSKSKDLTPAAEEEKTASETMKPEEAAAAKLTVGSYTTLRVNDSGDAVTALQDALHKQGYLNVKPTGKYAAKTEAAVKAFQKAHGLRETGIAGPATQRILFGTAYAGASDMLKEGSTGTDVAELQYTLWELGYYEGKVNGVYGQSTVDAVKAFQQANGVSPTNGQVGSKTRAKLYSASPVGAK